METVRGTYGSPETTIAIAGFPVPGYVLPDQRRVLAQRPLLEAWGLLNTLPEGVPDDPLSAFLTEEPFLADHDAQELMAQLQPIQFAAADGSRCCGYDANALLELCQFVHRHIGTRLAPSQQRLLARTRTLIRLMPADMLIDAIDDVTGYRQDRDRATLNAALKSFLAPAEYDWAIHFADEFYRELFRLKEWRYIPLQVSHPRRLCRLIVRLVFQSLPRDLRPLVLQQTPGRFLGRPHEFSYLRFKIEKHVDVVTALMQAAENWRAFRRLFARALHSPNHRAD